MIVIIQHATGQGKSNYLYISWHWFSIQHQLRYLTKVLCGICLFKNSPNIKDFPCCHNGEGLFQWWIFPINTNWSIIIEPCFLPEAAVTMTNQWWGRRQQTNKMAAILQMTFSIQFSWMKFICFDSNCTVVCSKGSGWYEVSIGLDDGLVLYIGNKPLYELIMTQVIGTYMHHKASKCQLVMWLIVLRQHKNLIAFPVIF